MVEKVYFSFHYNRYVLRATSFLQLVTLFFIIMKTNINSRRVLSFGKYSQYLLVLFPSYFVTGAFKLSLLYNYSHHMRKCIPDDINSLKTLIIETVCCYKLLASTKHCFLVHYLTIISHPQLVSPQA